MYGQLNKINAFVDRARKTLSPYQFLTAFPQIVSRILHSNAAVRTILVKIMGTVIISYPQQALWPTVGVMQSNRLERKNASLDVLKRVQVCSSERQS
jgi:serine/threonine-protein kinase ATR